MKPIVTALILWCACATIGQCQSIIGTWQLMKQTSCLDDNIELNDEGVEEVLGDMKNMGGPTPQIIKLKENNAAEESTKIVSRKKSYNSKSFLYKYDGQSLYFLDKKSRTIIEGFTVEKFEGDSLIISNSARACETKVFLRIK
ncbi:MAG TPA: hypothetical protein VGK59_24025 [Ohtaekwangia sp.]